MSRNENLDAVGHVHYVSTPDAARWSDSDIATFVTESLGPTAEQFAAIYERAQRVGPAVVDRVCGVIVGVKPKATEPAADNIMFIAELDTAPRPENPDDEGIELFTLKAASRAFGQAKRGVWTDLSPMYTLSWLREADPDQRAFLHRGAAASAAGIHVGMAGPWPHHSRDLAATFAMQFAENMGLEYRRPGPIDQAQLRPEVKIWKAALEEGIGAGDNTNAANSLRRAQFGFALDLLDS